MKSAVLTLSVVIACLQSSFAGELMLRKSSSSEIEINQSERSLSTLKIVGNNGGKGFPLGNCEGDCDSDRECQSGLKCFQRSGSESVPGCSGDHSDYRGVDFCYRPGSGGGSGGGSSGGSGGGSSGRGFRIKMWWQKGYYWQEESFERKWCLQCRGRCRKGVEIGIRECSDGNTKFEFIGSGAVQIKVVNENLCMELMAFNNTSIQLQECSSTNRQKFTAGPGDFNGKNFELQTVAVKGCLSQPHHPRDGEIIRRQGCDGARHDTTSLFNKY